MYNFKYVDINVYKPEKEELIEIIKKVQDEVRDSFTFEYVFVGSSTRKMISCDYTQNVGYDFDVDIRVNNEDNYSENEIKIKLMDGFDEVNQETKYGNCKDSTRVFTIKVVDADSKSIHHACDFAVIKDCNDGQKQYIHHNKKSKTYTWEYKSQGYYELPEKEKWIKGNKLWANVRSEYIDNKNKNKDINKHSSSIYAETINNVANNNGYRN